jgi:hypothetical protein
MADILTTPVIIAALGGLIVSILNLLEIPNIPKDRKPDVHSLSYWITFLAWPILGGVVGFLYNDPVSPLNKLVAFQLGISSPLLLRSMANVIPNVAKQNPPPGA